MCNASLEEDSVFFFSVFSSEAATFAGEVVGNGEGDVVSDTSCFEEEDGFSSIPDVADV